MCPKGCGLKGIKIQKLELWNFILKERSELYKNMHQRKFSAVRYYMQYWALSQVGCLGILRMTEIVSNDLHFHTHTQYTRAELSLYMEL